MKKFLYVILALVCIYLVLCFFGPKKVLVERETVINKPGSVVKSKLGDFKYFHDTWNPWAEKDPNMKNTYTGNPREVGHTYSWVGNKEVGEGSMTLIGLSADTVKEELTFKGMGNAFVNMITKENGNTTTVKWQMIMNIGFFHRAPMVFMNMDKMMAPDFEKGLSKLKTALEEEK